MAECFGCTVDELLNRISSFELSEWMAYYVLKRKEEEKNEKKLKSKSKPRRRH